MAAVLAERTTLTKDQLSSLRTYILKKREREKEANNNVPKKFKINHDDTDGDDPSGLSGSKDSTSNPSIASRDSEKQFEAVSDDKRLPESVPDLSEQLQSLRDKLESLKKEKHNLFQELKKVLHEEEEKRRQQHQKEQEQHNSMLAAAAASDYYRDPRMGQQQHMMRHSWSTPQTHEGPTSNRLQQTGSLQDINRYQSPHYTPPPLSSHRPQMQGYSPYVQHHGGQMLGRSSFKDIPLAHTSQGPSDLYHSSKEPYGNQFYPGISASGYHRGGVYPPTTSGQFFTHSMVPPSPHDITVPVHPPAAPVSSGSLFVTSVPHPLSPFTGGGSQQQYEMREYVPQYPYDPRQHRYQSLSHNKSGPFSPQDLSSVSERSKARPKK